MYPVVRRQSKTLFKKIKDRWQSILYDLSRCQERITNIGYFVCSFELEGVQTEV